MWQAGVGWQEAVVSVSDLSRWKADLNRIGGWEVFHEGTAGSIAEAWGIGAATVREAAMGHPADRERWVRLVEIGGVPHAPIRGSAQPWDTGGIFSLLVRTNDIEGVLQRAYDVGWGSFNDIDVMHFEGFENRNVVLRAPDGACFGLYESAKDPAPHAFCAPFTAQQMVRSIDPARAFYVDKLGWSPWYDGETKLAINQFGMPSNYKGKVPKNVSIVHAAPDVFGQVELVSWQVFEGRDMASRAKPPNRGHLALRYAVSDIGSALRPFGSSRPDVCRVEIAPFGMARLAAVSTPDGARIELVQPETQ